VIASGLVTLVELVRTRNGRSLLRFALADVMCGEIRCVMFPDPSGDLPELERRTDVLVEIGRISAFAGRVECVVRGGVDLDTGRIFGDVSEMLYQEAANISHVRDEAALIHAVSEVNA